MIYIVIIVAYFGLSGLVAAGALIRYYLMSHRYKKLVEEESSTAKEAASDM